MNARPWLVLLALLLIPHAVAQTATTSTPASSAPGFERVTVRLTEQSGGIGANERYEILVSDANAFNASARVTVQVTDAAQDLQVTTEHEGQSKTLEASRVQTASTATQNGLTGYQLDLSGLHPVSNGDTVIVIVTHTSGDETYRHGLPVPAKTLLVFATGTGGREPASSELGEFNPTGLGDEGHVAKTSVSAGYTYRVEFVDASAAPGGTRDLNPWLVGAVGAVGGFLVAWLLMRRPQRAKKFEKGGDMESGAMLEARRRTLMAALKELEVAHEAKEIPDNAYAPLKEEYKAQTVRVLRSLEEKREAPKT